MKNNRIFFLAVALALTIKTALFVFATVSAPESMFAADSGIYIETAKMLAQKGIFARGSGDNIAFETFRTPGYPIFLAALHFVMKMPFVWVLAVQMILTIASAAITYRAAMEIYPKIAPLSAIIVLFDLPITIFSMMILSETLFLLLISVFMLLFIIYLRDRKIKFLVLSAFTIAAAAYIRPIAYYISATLVLFIAYADRRYGIKRAIGRAVIFAAVVFSLLGAWQARNYVRCGVIAMSSVEKYNLSCNGLYKSYVRNEDPYTKGMTPPAYYVNVTARCLMSLMTRPGNLKYFGSDTLTALGKILAYPWTFLWIAGFLFGLTRLKGDIYLQAMFFMVISMSIASIGGVMWLVGERFRVPMMPFIAVISAYGWINVILRRPSVSSS
jgi:hypothetical protein